MKANVQGANTNPAEEDSQEIASMEPANQFGRNLYKATGLRDTITALQNNPTTLQDPILIQYFTNFNQDMEKLNRQNNFNLESGKVPFKYLQRRYLTAKANRDSYQQAPPEEKAVLSQEFEEFASRMRELCLSKGFARWFALQTDVEGNAYDMAYDNADGSRDPTKESSKKAGKAVQRPSSQSGTGALQQTPTAGSSQANTVQTVLPNTSGSSGQQIAPQNTSTAGASQNRQAPGNASNGPGQQIALQNTPTAGASQNHQGPGNDLNGSGQPIAPQKTSAARASQNSQVPGNASNGSGQQVAPTAGAVQNDQVPGNTSNGSGQQSAPSQNPSEDVPMSNAVPWLTIADEPIFCKQKLRKDLYRYVVRETSGLYVLRQAVLKGNLTQEEIKPFDKLDTPAKIAERKGRFAGITCIAMAAGACVTLGVGAYPPLIICSRWLGLGGLWTTRTELLKLTSKRQVEIELFPHLRWKKELDFENRKVVLLSQSEDGLLEGELKAINQISRARIMPQAMLRSFALALGQPATSQPGHDQATQASNVPAGTSPNGPTTTIPTQGFGQNNIVPNVFPSQSQAGIPQYSQPSNVPAAHYQNQTSVPPNVIPGQNQAGIPQYSQPSNVPAAPYQNQTNVAPNPSAPAPAIPNQSQAGVAAGQYQNTQPSNQATSAQPIAQPNLAELQVIINTMVQKALRDALQLEQQQQQQQQKQQYYQQQEEVQQFYQQQEQGDEEL